MKNEAVLSKGFQDVIKFKPSMSSTETGFIAKIGKSMKKVICIGSLAGIGLLFNSCAAGYVATVPVYNEYSRPQRPSDLHIWIDGNWVFNRQTRVYVQRNGYWQKPHQNQIYVSGHWQSTPRGHQWVSGKWQKHDNKGKGNSKGRKKGKGKGR